MSVHWDVPTKLVGHEGHWYPAGEVDEAMEKDLQTIADLERQLADALTWQGGMKVMLNHLADKLDADAWVDSEGDTITRDEMVAEVASNLRVFAAGYRTALEADE